MGNKGSKTNTNSTLVDGVYKQKDLSKQFHSSYNSSKSLLSVESQQSVYSISRPWSRVTRRRWRESTLTLPYEYSKTAWPVTQLESFFLPEFPLSESRQNNKFETLEKISQGAFGKIYKIKDLEENEIYALKVLSKSKVIESSSIKQVKEEVQIQRACGHHPFIVKCPLNWQSRKRLYIVTEFIEGGELWNILSNLGVLPLKLVQIYVAQIALAIDFLHNAGVIYRDLKPENILLDSDASIKLIDFGLSKWLPFGRTTKTVCGTPKFMAPEIVKLQPYGHAVDWWSLGVIACLMLADKMPTLNPGIPEKSLSSKVELPKDVFLDMASRDFLLRLLEAEPQKRLRSLRTLQTIAFYKGFNFNEVKEKRVRPRMVLVEHFGENFSKRKDEIVSFEGFDEVFLTD